ncbi:hypothetical protein C5S35_12575 [Candidatus Methanophagaceae archaeon]|nr:hypothetical protein C5S35_12575 [Methanophagales archaeon]
MLFVSTKKIGYVSSFLLMVTVVPNRGSFESKISTGTDMNITISKK